MTIVLAFLKMWWKEIAFAIVLIGLIWFIYNKGYNAGEADCKEAWKEAEIARIEAVNKKISEIQTKSETLAIEQNNNTIKVTKSLNKIINDINQKSNPTVVTHNYTTIADCKPSDEYVETWNEIAKQANTR